MENLLDFLLFRVPIFLLPRPCSLPDLCVFPPSLLWPPPAPIFSPTVTSWPSALLHKELCGVITCPLFTYSNIFQCLMMTMNNFNDLRGAHWKLLDTSVVGEDNTWYPQLNVPHARPPQEYFPVCQPFPAFFSLSFHTFRQYYIFWGRNYALKNVTAIKFHYFSSCFVFPWFAVWDTGKMARCRQEL